MTKSERRYIKAIIKYERLEFVYDEWAFARLRAAYRNWLKNLLEYGHPESPDKGKHKR